VTAAVLGRLLEREQGGCRKGVYVCGRDGAGRGTHN